MCVGEEYCRRQAEERSEREREREKELAAGSQSSKLSFS